MNFMGTQMHMVTFAITAFEVAALFFQVIYFLERPNDPKRLLYLILLTLFVLYNVTSGLFPDPNIPSSRNYLLISQTRYGLKFSPGQ